MHTVSRIMMVCTGIHASAYMIANWDGILISISAKNSMATLERLMCTLLFLQTTLLVQPELLKIPVKYCLQNFCKNSTFAILLQNHGSRNLPPSYLMILRNEKLGISMQRMY